MFEYTRKEILDCQTEIKTITSELKTLPEGYLVRKGGFYYHGIKRETKGIAKDQQLIRQLARKAYLLERLKRLENGLAAGEVFLANCGSFTPEEIIGSLSKTYQRLPSDSFFITAQNDWPHQSYEMNPYHPEQRSIITDSGIAVRSKSEMIIANALDLYRIPYRYEAALDLGLVKRYPDFTIMRPVDEKLIYWEHFGLTDKSDYMQSMTAKIQLYLDHNIVPWSDLVCTFEDDIKDSKRIHHLISWFILRN